MYSCLCETAAGVVLQVQVQPRSSKNQLVGLHGEALKIKLTSPPVEGAANNACCAYLAKLFGVSKGSVKLIAGDKSRLKRILFKDIRLQAAEEVLQTHLEATS